MSEKKQLDIQHVLDNLRLEWKPFPAEFQALSSPKKSEYLRQQGFASFHDLLSHILAWWEEAIKIINSIMDMEELPRKEYDIDEFNSTAMEHFKEWTEEDLLIHFENIRKALMNMAVEFSPTGLDNPRIKGWLVACLIEHYQEHKINK